LLRPGGLLFKNCGFHNLPIAPVNNSRNVFQPLLAPQGYVAKAAIAKPTGTAAFVPDDMIFINTLQHPSESYGPGRIVARDV
jgi:hypothetical protein